MGLYSVHIERQLMRAQQYTRDDIDSIQTVRIEIKLLATSSILQFGPHVLLFISNTSISVCV